MDAQLNETNITVTRTVYGFSEKEQESKDVHSPYAVKSVRTIVTCDGETVYERKVAEHLLRKSYISPTLVDIFIDYISQLDQKAECRGNAGCDIRNGFHFRRHCRLETFNFKKKPFYIKKDMERKLTEKERGFLNGLRELMATYRVMLSSENDRVCIEVEYSGDEDKEPIILPEAINAFYDIDEFIEQNS